MDTGFTFPHGLGDSANAVHLFKLWSRRGYVVNVKPTRDKEWLWRSCGYNVVDDVSFPHPWIMPPEESCKSPWCNNKTYANFKRPYHLPELSIEGWDELLNIKLNLDRFVSEAARSSVARTIKGLISPIFVLHTVGNTGIELKSLDANFENDLIGRLLEIGSVVLINNQKRNVQFRSGQFRSVSCNVEELYWLIQSVDCMVGIDSGPFHIARLTNTPRIGLFFRMPAWHGTIPSPETICLNDYHPDNFAKKYEFNLMEFGTNKVDQVISNVRNVLSPRKFCTSPGADVIIQNSIQRLKHSSTTLSTVVDRHKSMSIVLEELSKKSNPLVVYLGNNAELITLLGFFLKQHDGFLYVINKKVDVCPLVSRMPVQVVDKDGIEFLSTMPHHIDLLCLGDHPVSCLQEAQMGLNISDMILIDNSPRYDARWLGNGSLVVPFLQENWFHAFDGFQQFFKRTDCQ